MVKKRDFDFSWCKQDYADLDDSLNQWVRDRLDHVMWKLSLENFLVNSPRMVVEDGETKNWPIMAIKDYERLSQVVEEELYSMRDYMQTRLIAELATDGEVWLEDDVFEWVFDPE